MNLMSLVLTLIWFRIFLFDVSLVDVKKGFFPQRYILQNYRAVYDIHDVIDITVFDEDKRGAPEFLGRVKIPLLSVSVILLCILKLDLLAQSQQ